MVAEYERAKILERSRRGKLHAARTGSVSVFSKAPYGYRYISKREGHGVASFEIIPSESRVVVSIFEWYALENNSLSQICDRLNEEGILKRSGRPGWDPTAVWDILREPAYKGECSTANRVSRSIDRDCDLHMVSQRFHAVPAPLSRRMLPSRS